MDLNQNVLEEVPLRVRRVDAPPVVNEHIEHAQEDNQEARRPLGLETDSNHRARSETEHGHERTRNGPLAVEHESNEQENEEHAASKLEAKQKQGNQFRPYGGLIGKMGYVLHAAIVLAERGETSKAFLGTLHCVTEDHDQAANDR